MHLFANQTSDAQSVEFPHYGGATGLLNIYVAGDLGGGTLTVEAELPDGSDYLPLAGGVITEPGMHVVSAAPFVGRVALAGSTGALLSVWVEAESGKTSTRVREDS